MKERPQTLVLGATGKTGRRVVDRLTRAGWPVRPGSRSGAPSFDWHDPSGWVGVLEGIDQVYIAYQPDLAVPEALPAIEELTRLAVQSGVRKLVLLSGRGEDGARACEQVIERSGVAWTIVRASWFAQNFDEGEFLGPIQSGTFALPTTAVGEPFVDAEDIAEVAAEALMSDRHDSQLYEVTGPQVLSFEDAVGQIAQAAGRQIEVTSLSPEDYRSWLVGGGMPEDFASFLADLVSTVLDGRNEHVADGVERALGRAPRDFSDYVRRAARSGVWQAA